jgi:Rrf2 family protein
MLIKKDTEYAIIGLKALVGQEEYVDVGRIAEECKIPAPLLSKIFQKLTRSNLVESKLGKTGGFRLKKAPEEISMREIIETVQGSKTMKCFDGGAPYCPREHCALKKEIGALEKLIYGHLSTITLEKLSQNKKGV